MANRNKIERVKAYGRPDEFVVWNSDGTESARFPDVTGAPYGDALEAAREHLEVINRLDNQT